MRRIRPSWSCSKVKAVRIARQPPPSSGMVCDETSTKVGLLPWSSRLRFRLKRIVLVGDRGMITQARIDADLGPAGFDWITALRAHGVH